MKNTFSASLFLAAMSGIANAQFDCATIPAASQAACAIHPEWAEAVANGGFGLDIDWTVYNLQTPNGYDFVVYRLTGIDGAEPADNDEFQPVLLIPGLFKDSRDWADGTMDAGYDASIGSMIRRLYEEKQFDVWVLQPRGQTLQTRTNVIFDPANQDFWDFDMQDIATNEVPLAIATIIGQRATDQFEPKTPHTVGFSAGGVIQLIALNQQYPNFFAQNVSMVPAVTYDLEALVGELITVGPYQVNRRRMLTDKKVAINLEENRRSLSAETTMFKNGRRYLTASKDLDIDADGNERQGRLRSLKKEKRSLGRSKAKSNKSSSSSDQLATRLRTQSQMNLMGTNSSRSSSWCSFDKSAYSDRRQEIRDMLTYSEYKDFWREFGDLKSELSDQSIKWRCNGTWEDLMDRALCVIDITKPECQPDDQLEFATLMQDLRDNSIWSLYGPDWSSQLDTYCEATKEACTPTLTDDCTANPFFFTKSCTAWDDGLGEGNAEIGLKIFEQLVQSSFAGELCEHSATWATDGWYTDCTLITLDSILDPVEVWLTNEDTMIDEDLIRETLRNSVSSVKTWNQLWAHTDFAGNNSDFFINELNASLRSQETA